MRPAFGEYEDRDHSLGLMGEERVDNFGEPRRRIPTALVTVGIMVVFAGGLWFAYDQGTRHPAGGQGANVPLIRADEHPTKLRPDQPGGMDIPDRDKLVLTEKPGGPPVERLLPGPEQPALRPAPPLRSPLPEVSSVEPGSLEPPPIGMAPTAPAPAAPALRPVRPTPPQTNAKVPAKPAAEAKPAAAALPQTAKPPGIHVQLASLHSLEAAHDEWNRLKRTNPDLLGKLAAVAVRADLGDKGIFYRIQAGPFADAAAAERLCGQLKQRNLGCAIAR